MICRRCEEHHVRFRSRKQPSEPLCNTPATPPHGLPLPANGTLVERKLLALQNVPIAATALAGTAGHNSVQTRSLELPLERRLDLATRSHTLRLLLLHTLALLHLLRLCTCLLLPPTSQALTVVCLVPLPEGRGVDLHDGALGEGVGADELVVGRVEGDGNDTDFAGDALAAPGEVAGVDAQAAEFAVAATGADEVDALGTDTGVCRLATLLEGSVVLVSVA